MHDTPVQWYVVLEVFCVVYVGKPPTRHVVVRLPTCVKQIIQFVTPNCIIFVNCIPRTKYVRGILWFSRRYAAASAVSAASADI